MRLSIIFILIQFIANGQISTEPEYIGGHKALGEFIAKNGHVPDSVKNGLIRGASYLELTIDTTGNIVNSKVNGSCTECKIEAYRLIKLMPKFKPATINNQKVVSTFKFPISFIGDPDSLLVYNSDNLLGKWVIQNENKLYCPECPTIIFNKDLTANLISDTLNWSVKNRKLTLANKNKPKRQLYFLSNSSYDIKFSEYFKVLKIENTDTKEKYILYKK